MIKYYCNFCLKPGEIQNPEWTYKNEYSCLEAQSPLNTLGTVKVEFLDCNGNNVHYCREHADFLITKALEEALEAYKNKAVRYEFS